MHWRPRRRAGDASLAGCDDGEIGGGVTEHDPEKFDYYQRLGISEDASTEEVEAAYRDLRRQFHPDAKPAAYRSYFDHAMKGINEAHDSLKDPAKRRRYDAGLRSLRGRQREEHPGARSPRGDEKASDDQRGGRRQGRGRAEAAEEKSHRGPVTG